MGKTSNISKQNWNAKNYTQVKVSVGKELASRFKDKCKDDGVSITSLLAAFMADYCGLKSSLDDYSATCEFTTRAKRRRAVNVMSVQLREIVISEEGYMDRMPLNFRESDRYAETEEIVDKLTEALDILDDVYNA
jgi:hypothetical protein